MIGTKNIPLVLTKYPHYFRTKQGWWQTFNNNLPSGSNSNRRARYNTLCVRQIYAKITSKMALNNYFCDFSLSILL